jgi:hypothetical protein
METTEQRDFIDKIRRRLIPEMVVIIHFRIFYSPVFWLNPLQIKIYKTIGLSYLLLYMGVKFDVSL